MWSIFGAIFGGSYWIAKIANEKSKENAAKTDLNQKLWRREVWVKSIQDYELNARLRALVETDDGFQALKDGAESVIRKLPGMEYADLYGRTNEMARYAAIFIEAVKHGKVPCGYESWIPELYLWNCTDIEFTKQAKIAFLRWVVDTLRSHGKNASIYFDTRTSYVFEWGACMMSTDGAIDIYDNNISKIIFGTPDEIVNARNAPKIHAKQQAYQIASHKTNA